MKYILMIIGNEESRAARSSAENEKHLRQHQAVDRELEAAGKNVGGHRLRPSREATTIRRRGLGCDVVDGPFAETKEVLGGFYLIEADSREEAIEWAKKLPLDEADAIEVRPVRTGAEWRGPLRGKQKYGLLFVGSEERLAAQSRDELFQAIDSHYELSLVLAAQGQFVAARSLGSSAEASTLRSQNGRVVVMDGPFAETKELVAGYLVVACDSKDEAIEWGKKLLLGLEAVEVRPVWEMS